MILKECNVTLIPLNQRREEKAKIRVALDDLKEIEIWDVHVMQAIHLLEEVLDNE